jgi:hypothetical protein
MFHDQFVRCQNWHHLRISIGNDHCIAKKFIKQLTMLHYTAAKVQTRLNLCAFCIVMRRQTKYMHDCRNNNISHR